MLTKEIKEQVTVLPDGQLQLKEVTEVYEDGVLIASNTHRRVISPGDDLTKEQGLAREVAGSMHTQGRVNQFKAKRNDG
jgi:hypothetical protein